ncbi:hypothetical protein [Methanolobus vulcani]|uniref:Uncharacterized protein n=1 Tax=Methanolobus vulcani TaxID=38026 RepID=A0A7Z8KQK4_9EURY|nr:hypothetical protein [Methanolobus vulcani]TQD28206.1 hypothetical protein FKV42_00595 [Methanolobus vulcani]
MSEKTTIPLFDKTETENQNTSCTSCTSCGGGCACGLGIKAGSEKEVVFRNIFLYITMGVIIFTVTYLATKLLAWINP